MQYTLELAAVYCELRIVITGIETTRFTPEFLAKSIGVDQFSGANANAIERLKETQFSQLLDRVWECVNTDTEFTNAARLLEYLTLNADGMQAQRRCKSPDPPAND
jgi:hypothetical protein